MSFEKTGENRDKFTPDPEGKEIINFAPKYPEHDPESHAGRRMAEHELNNPTRSKEQEDIIDKLQKESGNWELK